MKKYVKFTEGRGIDLTPNRAYEVIVDHQDGTLSIRDDDDDCIWVKNPDLNWDSRHTNSKWQWCDENGREILS